MFKPASDRHPDIDRVTADRRRQIAVSSVAKMRFRFMANGCLCKGLACPVAPCEKRKTLWYGLPVADQDATLGDSHLGISAIIAAYNEEKTIAEVLSVLTKSPMIDEIIVV